MAARACLENLDRRTAIANQPSRSVSSLAPADSSCPIPSCQPLAGVGFRSEAGVGQRGSAASRLWQNSLRAARGVEEGAGAALEAARRTDAHQLSREQPEIQAADLEEQDLGIFPAPSLALWPYRLTSRPPGRTVALAAERGRSARERTVGACRRGESALAELTRGLVEPHARIYRSLHPPRSWHSRYRSSMLPAESGPAYRALGMTPPGPRLLASTAAVTP